MCKVGALHSGQGDATGQLPSVSSGQEGAEAAWRATKGDAEERGALAEQMVQGLLNGKESGILFLVQGEATDVDLKQGREGAHLCFDTTWCCVENGLDVDNSEGMETTQAAAAL